MRFTSSYVCQQCTYTSPSYLGKCPNCGSWNSFVETVEEKGKSDVKSRNNKSRKTGAKPVRLAQVEAKSTIRTSTGNSEIDLVLGGGVVPGMAVLLTGEPGIGKSTLLLELANQFLKTGGEVLYVAGEESAGQIKIRANRLKIKAVGLTLLEETDVDVICEQIKMGTWKAVIVDSIQTMTTEDLTGSAGSVGQVRESAGRILATTKNLEMPVFLVGHVTKDGTIAGPKVIEHAVDTILTVEGEKFTSLRLIRSMKNRFGPTDEVGILEMSDTGLIPVTDYQRLFTDDKKSNQAGSCYTITMEGTRPLLVEIQALVTTTPLPMPRRVASGINLNRLQMILAVLQKRLSLPLYKEDVYVSVSGGLSISEPAADLAVALAILSSYKEKPLQAKMIAFGELDLMGNIRKVNSEGKRIKEAKKLGFATITSSETLSSLNNFKI